MIEHREYRIEPGDVFIVNANDFHQPILDAEQNRGAVVAYLGSDVIGDTDGTGSWMVPFMLAGHVEQNRLRDLPRVRELMEELHAAYTSEAPHWQSLCRGILAHMLALVTQRCAHLTSSSHGTRRTAQIGRFADVLQFINAHLEDDIDAHQLYRIAGLSRSQFCERFKAAFGTTVAAYVLRQRINRATRLLRSTDLSVTEICHLCGFNWLGYFNAAFKRQTGMSPTQFRQS